MHPATAPSADPAAGVTERRLLHISSSPRGAASESLALASTFLEAVSEAQPHVDIDHLDLWDGTLPQFGPAAAAAKMAVFAGVDPQGDEARAWSDAVSTFRRFDAADSYLFTVPMWNAGVPYILKQFIDVVSQPGLLFSFDPTLGYRGLLSGKRAAVIYTGAVYGPDRGHAFGSDFQSTFFEDWLRWGGIDDIRTVRFQPNLATADADGARAIAQSEARVLGQQLYAVPSPASPVALHEERHDAAA